MERNISNCLEKAESEGHYPSSELSHLEERCGRSELKMAGHREVGRNISSLKKENPYLFDFIQFQHTQLWKSETFLTQKYVIEQRSIAQISREILSSRASVRRALNEFGIPLRKQGKPGLRPAQVPYGFRREDGLLVLHLGEQRVIQSVRKMFSDGLSYRKICEFLTALGVPTKNRGKKWQPEMVSRLLKTKSEICP
jgi:hypothetical protein